eukprot:5823840-Pyramimonas_sp.AAC.1
MATTEGALSGGSKGTAESAPTKRGLATGERKDYGKYGRLALFTKASTRIFLSSPPLLPPRCHRRDI